MKISKVKRANIKKSQKKGPGKKKKLAQKNALAKTHLDTSALKQTYPKREDDSGDEFDIALPKGGGKKRKRDTEEIEEHHTDIPLFGYKNRSNNVIDPDSLESSILNKDESLQKCLRMSSEDYEEEPQPEPEEKKVKVSDDGVEDTETVPETHGEKIHRLKAEKMAAKKSAESKKKEKINATSLLSIKVDNQIIKQYKAEEDPATEIEAESSQTEKSRNMEDVERKLPTVTREDLMKEQQRKMQKHREYIGSAGPSIMNDPPNKMGKLLGLIKCVAIKDPLIRVRIPKLAAKSCLKVFLNILPSYRLGALTPQPGKLMKKDTQDIALFEGKLLNRYEFYLKSLEQILDDGEKNKFQEPHHIELGRTALSCLLDLLRAKPVFNFSDDLILLLVPYMSHQLEEFRVIALETFIQIFQEDVTMQFSERIVKAVRTLVKQKNYLVHADLFKSLLHLKLENSTSLDFQAEKKATLAKEKLATKNNLIKMKSFSNNQLNVKERKKQRKITILEHKLKGKKEEEKKAKEVTIQTEILSVVFTLFVHVIKNDVNRKLLSVVLEGLAKFGHLVNVEYFTSLISNLDTVTKKQKLSVHETIHCVQTVFKMLRGLGSTVISDLSHFTIKLYAVLSRIDPADPQAVTALEPGLRAVLSIFIGCKTKITPLHCVGFVKMLCSLAVQIEPKYAIPILLTVRTLMLTHEGCSVLLDASSDGSPGPYRPHIPHPALCNPQAACMWELRLLAESSTNVLVRQIANHLAGGLKLVGDGSVPASITKLSVEEVFRKFVHAKAEPVFREEDLASQSRNKAERRQMMARIANFTGESIPQETTVIAEKTKRKGETSNPSSRQRVKMNA